MLTHYEILCPNIVTYLPFYYNLFSTMPTRGSALNCRSGYDGEDPIPVFKMREEFSDEEKDQLRIFAQS